MTALFLLMTSLSFGQNASIDAPWSGWAQCEIKVQGPGYSHSETHIWTLTGGAPSVQGAMRVHPATWKVTGQGSFSRTQGAQTLTGQWTTNATQNAPLALFVRASDGRLIIKAWHSQLRSVGGVVGTQQQSINGVLQSPGAISLEAFEWAFPVADAVSTSQQISGSSSTATGGAVGPMQPGGSQGTAVCSWQFAAGGNTVTSSPTVGGTPPTPAGTGTGATSTGANPSGTVPGGTNPTGTAPGGTSPGVTNPGGANPVGLTPPGSPGPTSGSNPGNGPGTPPASNQTPTPQITQVTPSSAQQGALQIQVTITGKDTHFAQGTTALSFGPGILVSSPVVAAPNTLTAQLSIDASAAIGQRDATAATGSEVASLSQAFNVAPGSATATTTLIDGAVQDVAGSPEGGVLVEVHRRSDDSLLATASTDANGNFSLRVPSAGVSLDVYLTLTKSGFLTARAYWSKSLTTEGVAKIVLFDAASLNFYYSRFGKSPQTNSGMVVSGTVVISATDCNNVPLTGATGTTSPFNTLINPSATAGLWPHEPGNAPYTVVALNQPPGLANVSASGPAVTFPSSQVLTIAGQMTYIRISPTFCP